MTKKEDVYATFEAEPTSATLPRYGEDMRKVPPYSVPEETGTGVDAPPQPQTGGAYREAAALSKISPPNTPLFGQEVDKLLSIRPNTAGTSGSIQSHISPREAAMNANFAGARDGTGRVAGPLATPPDNAARSIERATPVTAAETKSRRK